MISIRNLQKRYAGKTVLKDVNLEIPHKQKLVILGRSGCGKSVLLKHIAGIYKPDKGTIEVDGKDISRMDRLDFLANDIRISILFQNSALFDSLTIRENVGFYLDRYSTMGEAEKDALVKRKLEMVDLRGIEQLKPHQISGGMQKRVALARSLMMEPEIMLYDEPTTGLDPITADSINNLINDLNTKLGITSIIVTHDMQSAFKIADKLAMLHQGEIIFHGTKEEIQASENPVVLQFLKGVNDDIFQ
jgi:phospholipid/cholesterol/gamma-HCH transport system ATP-binding protein